MIAAPLTLRQATSDDAATLAVLSMQVFCNTYAIDGISHDVAREIFAKHSPAYYAERLQQPRHHFVLAERNGALLGFAETLLADLPAPAGNHNGAELMRLYVQPQAQGQGIGKALMMAAEQCCLDADISGLWLTAWDGNTRALAFYRRMAYVDVGGTEYRFQETVVGNRVMWKGEFSAHASFMSDLTD